MTTFRRSVRFEPGYNYLHETGPQRRGQHGMEIRFLLTGPLGAVQFSFGTMWTPLGEVDAGSREPVHVDHHEDAGWGRSGLVRVPSGHDVGHHWLTPTYEGESSYGACSFLGGRPCYYDGSGLRADDWLPGFIREGEPYVWRKLIGYYRHCASPVEVSATP